MVRFDFAIRTRDGQKIESLVIGGLDQQDAERKLNQMYRYCEILSCEVKEVRDLGIKQSDTASVEDILSLISK
jgi:hypothetical protein